MSGWRLMRTNSRYALVGSLGMMLIATASIGSAHNPPVRRMLVINNFSFGPVGFGTGKTSEGENLYNKILKSPTALEDFRYIWKHGTPEARAYALTAFWKLDRAEFERDATEFMRENPTVRSQHVDVMGRIPANWVVEGIRNGVPSYRGRAPYRRM
jgi:hypothetical protein